MGNNLIYAQGQVVAVVVIICFLIPDFCVIVFSELASRLEAFFFSVGIGDFITVLANDMTKSRMKGSAVSFVVWII